MSVDHSAMTPIFFDLDGPLLDVSGRYATLHRDVLGELGASGMDARLYWQRKRARVSEEAILEEIGLGHLATSYEANRLSRIESAPYLAYDRAWPWTERVLQALHGQFHLVIVTVRSDRTLLLEQLQRLNLGRWFQEILSEPAGERVDEQKATLMRSYCVRRGLRENGHWMIGDTEADVAAGHLLSMTTAAVLCGIRDREHLAGCRPDFLLRDIRELLMLGDEKTRAWVDCGGSGHAGKNLQACTG